MSQADLEYLRNRSDAMADYYDKALFALAGGALTLSVTLADRLAADPVEYLPVLVAAWVALAGCVIILLGTYLLAASSLIDGYAMLKAGEDPSKNPTRRIHLFHLISYWMSVGAGILFVVGVALVGYFTLANL